MGDSRLTFVRLNHRNKRNQKFNLYQCSCGNQKIIIEHAVKSGGTKSCGCLLKELSSERGKILGATLAQRSLIKHGMCNKREYHIWSGIKKRCCNKSDNGYRNYGARGITMCKEWKNSFENFYTDMGDSPTNQHSIDRIDNNLGYCKENCRWATGHEQATNKRNTVYVMYNNTKHPMATLIRNMGLNDNFIRHAVCRANKSFAEALILHKNIYGK